MGSRPEAGNLDDGGEAREPPEPSHDGEDSLLSRHEPTPVVGGHTFLAQSAGFAHTSGVVSDGMVYCWGANGSGRLGDGGTSNRTRPELVVF